MLVVALSAGAEPWIDAVSGAFVPADIAQDAAAARLFVDRINPYGPAIREPHARLIGLPVEATFPHFPHPPFSLIVSLPLAFSSFQLGAAFWFTFTIALILGLAALLASCRSSEEATSSANAWRFFVLLLLWPPVLYCLEKGQWSVLLAVLLTASARSAARDDLRMSAIWGATAAAVKVFPVLLGIYFLLRSARSACWFLVTGAVLTLIPLVWIGPDAFAAFVRESRLNMPYWESFPLVMFSIHGAISRLFVGGKWAEPFIRAPLAAMVLETMVVSTLLAVAVWSTVQTRRRGGDEWLAFSAWLILLPLLNPQSLGHNGVLLALPIVVVAQTLTRRGRPWHRWAWACSLILISVPKQTVWRFAAPPVDAVAGIAIASLPAWGALLLFLVTTLLASDACLGAASVVASGKMVRLPTSSNEHAGADLIRIGRPARAR
jgi:hypothetical protein